MKKILILTDQDDAHGRVVTTALRKKGVWASRWNPRDFLLKHKINLFFQPRADFDIVSKEININL